MMLKEFRFDLHVHTCLSPCGDPSMLPKAVAERAAEQDLSGIGICDHNTAENVAVFRSAGEKCGVYVVGGMEVTSAEEAHVLTFFEDDAGLGAMQAVVLENLPGENDEVAFGEQWIVDEDGSVTGVSEKLLIGATTLGLDEIVAKAHELGGIAIASHIDRESFSIIGQLGFIPDTLPLDAAELSPRCDPERIQEFESHGLPLVRSSDAHFLTDIGKVTTGFLLGDCTFGELAMALSGKEGRKVVV